MNYLMRLKLGQKLNLMVLIPLIAMIGFALVQSYTAYDSRSTLVKLEQMATLGVFSSNLVHELQKERGMTAGFIGSQGQKFTTKLTAQRKQVDVKAGLLANYLKGFNAASVSKAFKLELIDVSKRLQKITTMRKSVDNLSISLGQALGYYSKLNASYITLISQMSTVSSNGELAIKTTAYANFLQAKERAGIERAVLANVFATDQMGGLFNKLMALITTQKNYIQVFESLTTAQELAFYRSQMKGQYIEETQRMRDIAIKYSDLGGFGIDSGHWFKMQTGKIGLLKKVEDNLSQQLMAKAGDLKQAATFALLLGLITSLVATTISIVLSTKIVHLIKQQLGGEPDDIELFAQQIAAGKLNIASAPNPTGILAAMQTLQQQLSRVIEQDISKIINDARQGNLSSRINVDDKQGFYKELSAGINELVEVSALVIDDTRKMFSALEQGDLSNRITRSYQGDFDQLKQDANATCIKIEQVVQQDIQGIINAARQGDLTQRIELVGKTGFFKELSEGINDLVDAVEGIFDDLATSMASMAQGNLTVPIDKQYQGAFEKVKQDVNRTMNNFDDTITKVLSCVESINVASDEISIGNTDLSNRTEQQAASLEQTSASMAEFSETVKANSDNAQQASTLATAANSSAIKGGGVVSDAVIAMGEINIASNKISEIIVVIDEIAFQTRLLSLNASVEAARAGEQGRGFAVVATEVRNLAIRSAEAAKEIKGLIKDSLEKVDVGTSLVNKSGETLEDIVQSVRKVNDIVAKIASDSGKQSSAITQVNIAVDNMEEMTQQNAALAEQTSAASVALNGKAGEMVPLMAFFTTSQQPEVTKIKPKIVA